MLKIVNKHDFMKCIEESEAWICVGVGKKFQTFCATMDMNVLDKLKYIADNDELKHGKTARVGLNNIEIQSVESLKGVASKNIPILISVNVYNDILEQLNELGILEEVPIFCYRHIEALEYEQNIMEKEIPLDFKITTEQMIPKIIHYCWFGGKELPDEYKKYIESWRKFCPDWEIKEWNESNYDVTKNKYMLQAYQSEKWGFVPDYARLDIIYNHGGVYLDTDVELVNNIDDLLYQEGFMGFEGESYVALGLGFGAKKHHMFIKNLMEDYEDRSFILENGQMNMVASPILQTEVMKRYGLITNGEYQICMGMSVYPEKVLTGKSPVTRRIACKPYTKAIHHYAGSWLTDEQKRCNRYFEEDMKLT